LRRVVVFPAPCCGRWARSVADWVERGQGLVAAQEKGARGVSCCCKADDGRGWSQVPRLSTTATCKRRADGLVSVRVAVEVAPRVVVDGGCTRRRCGGKGEKASGAEVGGGKVQQGEGTANGEGARAWSPVQRAVQCASLRTRQTGAGACSSFRSKRAPPRPHPVPRGHLYLQPTRPPRALPPRSCTRLARRDEGYRQRLKACKLGHS
jgi:hypothetical protein